jgi:transcriptional regulator with PAS, ATPase and Fis domain
VFKTTDFAKMLAEHREMNAGLFSDDAVSAHAAGTESADDISDNLDDAIRRHVRRVFEKHDSNISKAAAALNITRTTLRKWL